MPRAQIRQTFRSPTISSAASLRFLKARMNRSAVKRLTPSHAESCVWVNTSPCRLAKAIHSAQRPVKPNGSSAFSRPCKGSRDAGDQPKRRPKRLPREAKEDKEAVA